MPQAQKRRRRGQWPRKVREALPDRPVGTATKVQALGATPTRRRCPVPGGSTRWFGPQGRLRRCARRDCVCHRADTQTVFRRCIASYPKSPRNRQISSPSHPRGGQHASLRLRVRIRCAAVGPRPSVSPRSVSVAPGSLCVFFPREKELHARNLAPARRVTVDLPNDERHADVRQPARRARRDVRGARGE